MVIGSGFAKGLKLKTPKGETTRPTSARVRGAVLNMLTPYLDDAVFLDLFAGSGAMGIEAVSRGAKRAVFVEMGKEALGCLRVNVAELERRAKAQSLPAVAATIVGRDVLKAVPEVARHAPFDVLFADPPYKLVADWARAMLEPLAGVAAADAILVVESAAEDGAALAGPVGGWRLVKQKSYGDTMITMLGKGAWGEGGSGGESD